MGGLRMGWLFWFLVVCAGGFARYYFLARRDGDGPLASPAVAGLVLMCVAAVKELLAMLP